MVSLAERPLGITFLIFRPKISPSLLLISIPGIIKIDFPLAYPIASEAPLISEWSVMAKQSIPFLIAASTISFGEEVLS